MRLRETRITLDDVIAGIALAVILVASVWIAAGLSPELVTP